MQNYLYSEIYRTFENNHEITCKLNVCRLPISFDQATTSFVQLHCSWNNSVMYMDWVNKPLTWLDWNRYGRDLYHRTYFHGFHLLMKIITVEWFILYFASFRSYPSRTYLEGSDEQSHGSCNNMIGPVTSPEVISSHWRQSGRQSWMTSHPVGHLGWRHIRSAILDNLISGRPF